MGELSDPGVRRAARALLRHAVLGDRAAVEQLVAGLDDDDVRRVIIAQTFAAVTSSTLGGPPVPYFEGGGVFISSRVAAVWSRILSAPRVSLVLDYENNAEEVAAREGVRRAAKAVAEQVRAARRNGETPDDDLGAWSAHEWISTGQAAQVLGVSVRRVQQLAAAGLGRLDAAGRWRLSVARVRAYCDEQRGHPWSRVS